MQRLARLLSRSLVVAVLLVAAAACGDRPTEPAHSRRATLPLGEGDPSLVVGSTVRGVARLLVVAEAEGYGTLGEWEFANERPAQDEAWGGIPVPAGSKPTITLRGLDVEGRELFAGQMVVAVEGDEVPQVRAAATLAIAQPEGMPAPEVYAGSYRVGVSPRWDDAPSPDETLTLWLHDARGERLPFEPGTIAVDPADAIDVGKLDPTTNMLDLHWYGDWLKARYGENSRVVLCLLDGFACTPLDIVVPSLTPLVDRYREVAADGWHTCARRESGVMTCWGHLGRDGAAMANGDPLDRYQFVDIDTDHHHTCALDVNREVWCWGDNSRGQLGAAGILSSSTPERVGHPMAASGRYFINVEVGRDHSCAVDSWRDVWCWGDNSSGELGDGTGGASTAYSDTPVKALNVKAYEIEADRDHTCAMTLTNRVKCWGSNVDGVIDPALPPNRDCLGYGESPTRFACATVPTQVPDVAQVIDIGMGGGQVCVIQRTYILSCWGRTLVDANPIKWEVRPRHEIDPVPMYRRVTVGETTACAITWSWAVRCFGVGNLGRSPTVDADTAPGYVASPPVQWEHISVGTNHVCGISLLGASLFCWGASVGGEWLGYTPTTTPFELFPRLVTVF